MKWTEWTEWTEWTTPHLPVHVHQPQHVEGDLAVTMPWLIRIASCGAGSPNTFGNPSLLTAPLSQGMKEKKEEKTTK